jgi:hypothetical protein
MLVEAHDPRPLRRHQHSRKETFVTEGRPLAIFFNDGRAEKQLRDVGTVTMACDDWSIIDDVDASRLGDQRDGVETAGTGVRALFPGYRVVKELTDLPFGRSGGAALAIGQSPFDGSVVMERGDDDVAMAGPVHQEIVVGRRIGERRMTEHDKARFLDIRWIVDDDLGPDRPEGRR